jgi:hypothetical protein
MDVRQGTIEDNHHVNTSCEYSTWGNAVRLFYTKPNVAAHPLAEH